MSNAERTKQTLIKMISDAGAFLVLNAEDIVGKLDMRNGLSINIDFCDYDGMIFRYPKVQITHGHLIMQEKEIDEGRTDQEQTE